MRLGILSGGDGWHRRDLERAAREAGVRVTCFDHRDLVASVRQGEDALLAAAGSGHALAGVDVLLVRAMPPGSLEQVVFRMDALQRLSSGGVHVINPPRAIECAVDKYLALARLSAQGLPVPRTLVCERASAALRGFAELGGDVVVKPLFGSGGRGMMRIDDEELARRAFDTLEGLGLVIYQQEFIHHAGWDYRILLAGDRVLSSMRRVGPGAPAAGPGGSPDWRTNISRGGSAEKATPPAEIVELARSASRVVGTVLAGVDIVPGPGDRPYVLEVNAAPGWRALAAVTGQDIARDVLRFLEESGRTRSSAGESVFGG